jgi:HEAT repeat protein
MLELLQNPDSANPWVKSGDVLTLIRTHAALDDAPALAKALARLTSESRREILEVLAMLKNPKTVSEIQSVLQDGDVAVREAAVKALAAIGGSDAFQALEKAITDSDENVRAAAAEAIGHSKAPTAFSILLEALRGERSNIVLVKLVTALETFHRSEAIPALLATVKDRRRDFRVGQYRGVSRGQDGVYPALWTLLAYPRDEVIAGLQSVLQEDYPVKAKGDALHVLARIQDPRTLKLVLSAVDSTDLGLRKEAISVLGTFLDPSVLPRLLELLKDPDDGIRSAARKSIDEIRYYLTQQDLIDGEAGDDTALNELTLLLDDDNPQVRLAAVRALARLRNPKSLPALVRHRKDKDPAVRKAVDEALEVLAGSTR